MTYYDTQRLDNSPKHESPCVYDTGIHTCTYMYMCILYTMYMYMYMYMVYMDSAIVTKLHPPAR